RDRNVTGVQTCALPIWEAGEASRLLAASPSLAHQAAGAGATREVARAYFFEEIAHYLYAGDTALHFAAAAYEREIARELIARGEIGRASCRERVLMGVV